MTNIHFSYRGPLLKNPIRGRENWMPRDSRFDRNGRMIENGKKYHISFQDEIPQEKD